MKGVWSGVSLANLYTASVTAWNYKWKVCVYVSQLSYWTMYVARAIHKIDPILDLTCSSFPMAATHINQSVLVKSARSSRGTPYCNRSTLVEWLTLTHVCTNSATYVLKPCSSLSGSMSPLCQTHYLGTISAGELSEIQSTEKKLLVRRLCIPNLIPRMLLPLVFPLVPGTRPRYILHSTVESHLV